jgi:hypothetical protein
MAGDADFDKNTLLLIPKGPNGSNSILDASNYRQHCYAKGNVQIQSGMFSFDGAGDYILIEHDQNLILGGGNSFTVDTIINSDTAAIYATLFSNTDAGFGGGFFTWVFNNGSSNGLMALYVGNYSSGAPLLAQSTGAINDGNNHHIAVSYDAATHRWDLWKDGNSVANTTWNGVINTLYRSLNVGIDLNYGRDFAGQLGPFRIRNFCAYAEPFTPPAASGFLDYIGQIAGNIVESLPITDWRVTAFKCSDGSFAGTTTTSGTAYTVNCNTLEACNIVLAPKVDYGWKADKVATVGDYVVAANPDATPHLFKVTAVTGDAQFGGSEPTYNLSGDTASGNVTLTYVAPLIDPITLGPKFPS